MDAEQKKLLLSSFKNKIETIFNQYKTMNNYMAIYFSSTDKLYVTFKSNNTFNSTVKLSKIEYYLGFVYDTSGDFTTQTDSFLL